MKRLNHDRPDCRWPETDRGFRHCRSRKISGPIRSSYGVAMPIPVSWASVIESFIAIVLGRWSTSLDRCWRRRDLSSRLGCSRQNLHPCRSGPGLLRCKPLRPESPISSNLPPPRLTKRKFGDSIVGDEQIHAAIIINVGSDDSPGLSAIPGDSGRLAYVGERAISIVVKEPAGQG